MGSVAGPPSVFSFVLSFIKNPREVGTPFACSSAVADKMLSYFPPPLDEGLKILEVGPGTGAFTKKLVQKMGPNDIADLVEIDEAFCKLLIKKYQNDPRIRVHHMPIQNWEPSYQYDFVIAAVPLNALPNKKSILPVLQSYEKLAKKEAPLSSVEYVGTSTVREAFLLGQSKKDFHQVVEIKKKFFKRHGFSSEIVWQNLPPARVMQCRINASNIAV